MATGIDARKRIAHGRLGWEWAANHRDIIAAQRLRHRVSAANENAREIDYSNGLDRDGFDTFCHHLLVRDQTNGAIAACARVLTADQARAAGSFFSHLAFDIHNVLNLPGRGLEISRICIDPHYRGGLVINRLWSAVTRLVLRQGLNYVFGSISIQLPPEPAHADGLPSRLYEGYAAPAGLRVAPRLALPQNLGKAAPGYLMPPQLKACMDAGARVCGDPCWDPGTATADLFLLLRIDEIRRPLRGLSIGIKDAKSSSRAA